MTNEERATFVQQAYRYQEAKDNAVKAIFATAQSLDIETGLSATDAAALATKTLNETKTAAQVYNVAVEGVLTIDEFVDGPNRYALTDATYMLDGRVMKLIGLQIDTNSNQTILTVRG